jgi:NTP pyrophosphatase (non-canonical NTP hydrolase)
VSAIHQVLRAMQAEVREINVEKGWRDDGKTFGDHIALLHSELSEALEAFRDWGVLDGTLVAVDGATVGLPKPEGVGSELADVLIRLLDTCDVWGIDLANEYERKIAYNATRPYRHGDRAL